MFVSESDRAAFRGSAGTYTWTSVFFEESNAKVRWDASSGGGSCLVDWSIDGDAASIVHDRIKVPAGDRDTGSDRIDTPFSDAVVLVKSSCANWLVTLAGYTPPPPTPKLVSGGGGTSCHPSYQGACLKEGIGDYDCAGGSGNGPNYVSGPVRVVGYDEFDLDRDGDGVGCQNS
jgi:hypothetical protein